MGLFGSTDVGIDLGTSSILVYARGRGIVLNEPSVVAVERGGGRLVAVGAEARRILGRAPADIAVIRPLRDGVISNFDATARMMRHFFKKVVGNSPFYKPRVVACVPSGVTEAEKRCVVEAAREAGAKHCYLIQEPVAAAIGAGLDINAPSGSMIVDIGGGTTDVAVLSYGSVVVSDSIKCAGDRFDAAVQRYMRKKHGLVIGDSTAEQIKIEYCRAHIEKDQEVVEIAGRSLLSGLPEAIPVATNELVDALAAPLSEILECVRGLSEKTPPELSADIRQNGIFLTGGGALLRGLDLYLSERTGLPCRLAEDPVACVAIGTGRVLEEPSVYGRAVYDYRRGVYDEA